MYLENQNVAEQVLTSGLKTQGRVMVGQGQRTAWAIKEQGGREAKHWSQAPTSQSRTINLPSQFTRHFPLFNLGQRVASPGVRKTSLLLMPTINAKALRGASVSPAVTGVPFDILTSWHETVTPPHSQGGVPFWGD